MLENIPVVICLILGFLWLRTRSRHSDAESRSHWVVLGIFIILPAMLILEKHFFDNAPLEPPLKAVLQCLALLASFALVGFIFLGKARQESLQPEEKTQEGS